MPLNWDTFLGDNSLFFIFAILIYIIFDGYLSLWYKKSLLRRVLTIFLEFGLLALITLGGVALYPDSTEIFLFIFTFTAAAIILFPLLGIFLECLYLLAISCLRALWKVTRIENIQILPDKKRPGSYHVFVITRM